MPKATRKNVHNPFTGYQVEEIMRVCVVSRATAQHFKRGSRAPSPQASRLWWLHVQGRILGSAWRFLRCKGDALVDDADTSYTEGEIRTLPFLHQRLAALERDLSVIRRSSTFDASRISEVMDAAEALAARALQLRQLCAVISGGANGAGPVPSPLPETNSPWQPLKNHDTSRALIRREKQHDARDGK